MFDTSGILRRAIGLFVLAAASAAFSSGADAQTIDVSLNVRYNTPGVNTSGGTWQLVAKSSHAGLYGLEVYLRNVNAPSGNLAPRGEVNADDPAGFSLFQTQNVAGARRIQFGQVPVGLELGPSDEESVFYGVGTLPNGTPGVPGGIGPMFTSLHNEQGVPWAVAADNLSLGNPAWSTAVLFAEGTLMQGLIPGFQSSGYRGGGNVFTGVGTSVDVGPFAFYELNASNTVVREVLDSFPGDFNDDLKVDAADYTVWRNNLGTNFNLSGNGDETGASAGTVDEADYQLWRQFYGTMPGPGGGGGGLAGGSPVPEPGSGILIFGAWGVLFLRRKSRFLRRVRVV